MFFQSITALAFAAAASAAIINVDVGDSTGALMFNPEAIVCPSLAYLPLSDLTLLSFSSLNQEIRLSTLSTKRTTP